MTKSWRREPAHANWGRKKQMQNTFSNTAATVIAAAIVTFLLNVAVGMITGPEGHVTVGPKIQIGSELMQSVRVANYRKETATGLRLEMPSKTVRNDIRISRDLSIERLSKSDDGRIAVTFVIGGIPPQSITDFLIPVDDDDSVSVLNAQDLDFELRDHQDTASPWEAAWRQALIVAAIYSTILGFMVFFLNRRIENTQKRIEELQSEFEKQENLASKVRGRSDDMRSQIAKLKANTCRRLADYQAENTFWRNTIRAILRADANCDSERLLEVVSRVLGTYSSLGQAVPDHETIDALLKDELQWERPSQPPTTQ